MAALLLAGCASGYGLPSQEIISGDIAGHQIIETKNKVENVYGMKPHELIIMCILAGWAIPSPWEMLGGIGKMIGTAFKGVVDLIRYARG